MHRKHSLLTLALVLFVLSFRFPVAAFGETPRAILDRSRSMGTPAEAARLLEKNLALSAGLRPYYLLELTRLAAREENWTKVLEWAQAQNPAVLDAQAADESVYWQGQALIHTGQGAKAHELYLKRIEAGLVRDPLFYVACLRIAPVGADRLIARLDAAFPRLAQTDVDTFALSRYLGGLAAVRSGDWVFAHRSLSRFTPAFDGRFPDYTPWARYYLAYSLYRQGRWAEAVTAFSYYLDTWKKHDYSWRAATAAAYSAIQAGTDPENFAVRAVSLAPTFPELAESVLLQASVLIDKKRFAEAETLLEGVADGRTTSGLTPSAGRARFMLADLAVRQNRTPVAAERYLALATELPSDPLAEEALYRSGEQWYIAGDWKRAAALASRYRQAWPSGRFLDSILWMGGDSFGRSGEVDLAILWWQALLTKFPRSPSSPLALRELIPALRKKADYPAALKVAEQYRTLFPQEARLDDIDTEIAELTLLRKGENPDGAALETAYVKAGRASTAEGRTVGLRLARTWLNDFGKRDEARTVLLEITAKAPRTQASLSLADRTAYATAWSLLGNLYRDSLDHKSAASALLSAGTFYAPIDAERAAEALYGAADGFVQAGLAADARKTVDTLVKTWPESVWTRRATRLIAEPARE